MLTLRPYQSDLIEKVRASLRSGKKSVLLQSATGSGKTALAAHIISSAVEKNKRVWFINHRREIIKQSVLTLTESADLHVGIVAAGFMSARSMPIQVCSVQTLARRRHLLPKPDLIIWDEAHHTASKSWSDIHADFPGAVHIGLTATPERLDGTGLGAWFEEIISGPTVAQLISDGFLSKYRLFAPGSLDLSSVHTIAGDYNKKELSDTMSHSTVVGDALSHYRKYCNGKRAVIFMWSVESSIGIAEQFNAAGIPAVHIDGTLNDNERDAAVEGFRSGRIKVLSNVEIISEGFDLPAIEAAFLLRPTQSLGLYLQQVGRALRPAPGKAEALIFDHSRNCFKHGLPDDDRQWSLDGRQKQKKKNTEAPVRQCPKCYAVVNLVAKACKWCNFVFEVQAREMKQVEGELQEVDLEAQRRERKREQSRAKSLEDLISVGYARKYRNPEAWAKHVWQAREAKQEAIG